jgi:inosine/xanthosine triphosphate pyrophosphatase family protein
LYATNNQGKIAEVSKLLLHNDIGVVSPKDLVKSHLKSGLVDNFERPRLFDLV